MNTPEDAPKAEGAGAAAPAVVREPRRELAPDVIPGFGTAAGFDLLQRQAKSFTLSNLVPEVYRDLVAAEKKYGKVTRWAENPNGLANCMIAINMATRMKADPLMVMQSLYIIEGRPSWASVFVGAVLNNCGRFEELEFVLSDWGQPRPVEFDEVYWEDDKKHTRKRTVNIRDRTCYVQTKSLRTGKVLRGPEVSIDMAVAEGWLTKKGSKWQTMPELMLHYRAQSFFGKLYASDLLMGLPDENEIIDLRPQDYRVINPADVEKERTRAAGAGSGGLAAALGTSAPPAQEDGDHVDAPKPGAKVGTGDVAPGGGEQAAPQTQAGAEPAQAQGAAAPAQQAATAAPADAAPGTTTKRRGSAPPAGGAFGKME